MTNLTGIKHQTSEQHIELGASRQLRDAADFKKINFWFKDRNLFQPTMVNLQSLSSSLTESSNDNINCDEAEAVGNLNRVKLDCKIADNCSIKRKDQVHTFRCLQPATALEKETVHINPVILFDRLTILIKREEEKVTFFKYELTPNPASLFKDGKMCKAYKAEFRNRIL